MKTGLLVGSISRRAGGIFHSSRRLGQQLQASGALTTEVFSLKDEFSDQFVQYWEPLNVHLFDVVGPRWFGYAPGFSDCLLSQGMELVHLHGIWMYPSVVAWRWSQSSRRPVVISSHGMLDPWALARSKLKKSIARLLFEDSNLRSARCLRSLCTAETNAIRRLGFRNPICQIPNGVDIPDRATQARAKPSQPTRKVLLYVGRLHPKKQLPSLLRAWKRLESLSIPGARDWELAIVGWDDANHQGELDALIDDLDVSRVRISGPVFGEELTSLLFEAAAFILPSLSEGLPMAVLEAWAHQLPVVMTPQCNLSDGFACGAAIKTAPDPESISRAIADLLQMSDYERADMGKRGLDLVKRKYSWPGVAEQVAAVYQWLLGGGPVPASVIL